MTPASVAERLRLLADSLGHPGVSDVSPALRELGRIAAEVEGPVTLKLVSSKPYEGSDRDDTTYVQEWQFKLPDGTKIETTTTVGWGEEPFGVPHGKTELNICGHMLTVEYVLGMVISTGDGPTEDGESVKLDGDWCSRMGEAGCL